jgi:hypothetical protein
MRKNFEHAHRIWSGQMRARPKDLGASDASRLRAASGWCFPVEMTQSFTLSACPSRHPSPHSVFRLLSICLPRSSVVRFLAAPRVFLQPSDSAQCPLAQPIGDYASSRHGDEHGEIRRAGRLLCRSLPAGRPPTRAHSPLWRGARTGTRHELRR